jgi:alkaline phosphatase D
MLDTRGLRDQQAIGTDAKMLADPSRSLLGAAQEAWFFDELRTSQRAGSRWRLIGQQILFTPLTPPNFPVTNPDVWDGYVPARNRVFDLLASEKITNVAILTGDIHSSWAMDVPRNPWTGYDATTGAGSVAIELVTPAISSPPFFASPVLRQRAATLRPFVRHLKFLEGEHNGYTLVDITRDRLQADWYHVDTVAQRSDNETKAASFVCENGSARLSPA